MSYGEHNIYIWTYVSKLCIRQAQHK